MTQHKLTILSIVLLALFTPSLCFAFPNEPDGYLDLKWGSAPTKDMVYSCSFNGNKSYYRPNDDLKIAGVPILEINYVYWQNQLMHVVFLFKPSVFRQIAEVADYNWGRPTSIDGENYKYDWDGAEASVSLDRRVNKPSLLILTSIKVLRESCTGASEETNAPQPKQVEQASDDKGFKSSLASAQQGDVEAQFRLGCLYERGIGTALDNAEAIKWYHQAAEQGHVKAQFNLALMYANARGTPQNYPEAIKWYSKAAEQGNARAQYSLAIIFTYGRGTQRNFAEAFKWYLAAAEQGHAKAQYSLGVSCMPKAMEFNRTMRKPLNGTENQPSKGCHMPKTTWALCAQPGEVRSRTT